VKFVFDNPDTSPVNLTEIEGVSGYGDSGGSAFGMENDKIMLVSVGSTQSTKKTNGIEGIYGVVEQYMRVSNYLDWIKTNKKSSPQTASTETPLNTNVSYDNESEVKCGLIGLLGLSGLLALRHLYKTALG
jgi:hypothetical protein